VDETVTLAPRETSARLFPDVFLTSTPTMEKKVIGPEEDGVLILVLKVVSRDPDLFHAARRKLDLQAIVDLRIYILVVVNGVPVPGVRARFYFQLRRQCPSEIRIRIKFVSAHQGYGLDSRFYRKVDAYPLRMNIRDETTKAAPHATRIAVNQVDRQGRVTVVLARSRNLRSVGPQQVVRYLPGFLERDFDSWVAISLLQHVAGNKSGDTP
jgi:hypothetical protein